MGAGVPGFEGAEPLTELKPQAKPSNRPYANAVDQVSDGKHPGCYDTTTKTSCNKPTARTVV